jgi:23S rRNA (cytosine1962-C5)-methyltransferase
LTFAAASHPPFSLTLAPLPSGQIGAFPEQAACWNWIAESTQRALADRPDEPPQVLNLFAYTGGSTLAAAAAGAAVCHVDAARSVVARARRNAERSRCANRPVRWLVEDALRFCRREGKRGRTYDALVLDPPTFGRGPDGQSWSLDRDLPELLAACGRLVAGRLQFALLTCHTPGYGPRELAEALRAEVLGSVRGGVLEQGELTLATLDGRRLPSGCFARWRV